jgi:hypothetical protein
MKKLILALLVSSLAVSGVAVAQQSGNQEQSSPRQGMMEEMKSGKEGDHMGGVMGMMKMMDQCSKMEGCCQTGKSGETTEGQKK